MLISIDNRKVEVFKMDGRTIKEKVMGKARMVTVQESRQGRAGGIDDEHSRRCLQMVEHVLAKDEQVVMEFKQSYFRTLAPARVIVTDKRLLIVRPSFFGLYANFDLLGPTRLSVVPYKNIISVLMMKGKILSTIHIRIRGFVDSNAASEGEVEGIRTDEAKILASYIENIVEKKVEQSTQPRESNNSLASTVQHMGQSVTYPDGNMELHVDQAMNLVQNSDKAFVWVGLEPSETIASLLKVDNSKVRKISIEGLKTLDDEGSKRFEDCVFISYRDQLARDAVRLLMKRHSISAYVLRGGIIDMMDYERKKLDT